MIRLHMMCMIIDSMLTIFQTDTVAVTGRVGV